MKLLSPRFPFLRKAASRATALCVLVTSILVSMASAVQITYTGYTIANGQLGTWKFKDAQVYLRFSGDTNDVQIGFIENVYVSYIGPYNAQQLCTGPAIYKGTASVTIISGGRTVHATFAPNQISVSSDLGGLDPNGVIGFPRGIGFGICGPNGFEVAYPLAIQDGTADQDNQFGTHQFSAELLNLNPFLTGPADFSGRAWVCFGFIANPGSSASCADTPPPLKTDKGDFYLFERYRAQFISPTQTFLGDTLTAGLFWVDFGGETDSENASITRFASTESDQPITYTGFLLTDVSVGGQFFAGAQVSFSVNADASQVQTIPGPGGPVYINDAGRAHVRVVSGGQTVTAKFASNQIYVYFDVANGGVGFGSHVNGSDYRGYPLTLTQNDCNSLTENSSVGAVSDIIRSAGADSKFYTTDVQRLVTNLRNRTALSGPASSCPDFTTSTSACAFSISAPGLQTDHGTFYIYEPYTDIDNGCPGETTVNWGVFRAEPVVEDN
jgi:hypothetical protein